MYANQPIADGCCDIRDIQIWPDGGCHDIHDNSRHSIFDVDDGGKWITVFLYCTMRNNSI